MIRLRRPLRNDKDVGLNPSLRNDKDVGSNPAATRNENTDFGQTPA